MFTFIGMLQYMFCKFLSQGQGLPFALDNVKYCCAGVIFWSLSEKIKVYRRFHELENYFYLQSEHNIVLEVS